MEGLYRRKTPWNGGKLYCSPVTRELIREHAQGIPLAMHCWHRLRVRGKQFGVYLLDAQHSLGSVMFLFDIGGKRILYTGDFVLHAQLREETVLDQGIDLLIADQTFAHPDFRLPPMKHAEQQLCALWRRTKSVGKTLVLLDSNFMNVMLVRRLTEKQFWPVLSPTLVHRPEYELLRKIWPTCTKQGCDFVIAHNSFRRTVAPEDLGQYEFVRLSAMWFTCQDIPRTPQKDSTGVWRVCCSNHVSFPDYQEFVRRLRPKKVQECRAPDLQQCGPLQVGRLSLPVNMGAESVGRSVA